MTKPETKKDWAAILAVILTALGLLISGVAGYTSTQVQVAQAEGRITKVETRQDAQDATLHKIEDRTLRILCKLAPSDCLKE